MPNLSNIKTPRLPSDPAKAGDYQESGINVAGGGKTQTGLTAGVTKPTQEAKETNQLYF